MKKERQGREKPFLGDGGVVPQKTFEDLQRKYRYIKKQKQDLQEELEEFKHKYEFMNN